MKSTFHITFSINESLGPLTEKVSAVDVDSAIQLIKSMCENANVTFGKVLLVVQSEN